MKLEEILSLVNAGFTRDDILKFENNVPDTNAAAKVVSPNTTAKETIEQTSTADKRSVDNVNTSASPATTTATNPTTTGTETGNAKVEYESKIAALERKVLELQTAAAHTASKETEDNTLDPYEKLAKMFSTRN